ncbi:uncharacterized protein LOC124139854 [Haliotis rufescens]|uniref:uncharacterized protein LOC124139854 n=1 Tax=Haliotis rufescens TaxID=6454 RepID=UPI00201F1579|nr:uncharacterized protein LOC124139854 [Haliotis rufescens]
MIKGNSPPQDASNRAPENAERSPNVQSANWKEHMLLQKRLHILNRSEKGLVHRIAIDQKVMFRRFQMKLHRSKLGYAQMMGDKDRVRELRALHLHGLNTNCGQSEGDYEFLKKLEYRPCSVDETRIPRSRQQSKKATSDRDIEELIQQVMKEQSSQQIRSQSASGRCVPVGGDNPRPHSGKMRTPPSLLPLRPATAAGTQVEKEFLILPDVKGQTVEEKINTFVANITIQNKNNTSENPELEFASKIAGRRQSRVSFAQNIPRTVYSTFPESTGSSRRESLTTSEGRSSRKSRRGSMFEEVKKTNLQEIFLDEARSVDHDPKVKEFCDSTQAYENTYLDRSFDYYAHKMQVNVEQTTKDDPPPMAGTPDLENYKFIGNTKVKSLTMPLLDLNFEELKQQKETQEEVGEENVEEEEEEAEHGPDPETVVPSDGPYLL